MQRVAALGHVGNQSALEVAIAQQRNFAQERRAHPQLQLAAHARD
jgi:hypothetical protein